MLPCSNFHICIPECLPDTVVLCERLLPLEAGCCSRWDALWWKEGDVSLAWGRKVGGQLSWSSQKEVGRRPWRAWGAPNVTHTVRPDKKALEGVRSTQCLSQSQKRHGKGFHFCCSSQPLLWERAEHSSVVDLQGIGPSSPDGRLWFLVSSELATNFNFWYFSVNIEGWKT